MTINQWKQKVLRPEIKKCKEDPASDINQGILEFACSVSWWDSYVNSLYYEDNSEIWMNKRFGESIEFAIDFHKKYKEYP